MVVHRRKKVTKYRGGSTHGGGARKKRRGAGSRGGRGRAGTGKRAGQKKAGMKDETLGSIGFRPRRGKDLIKVINVGDFNSSFVNNLVSSGKATKESSLFMVDLGKLGYQKLLGAGKTNLKLKIFVQQCSSQAAKKIKAVGGEVVSSEIESEGTK